MGNISAAYAKALEGFLMKKEIYIIILLADYGLASQKDNACQACKMLAKWFAKFKKICEFTKTQNACQVLKLPCYFASKKSASVCIPEKIRWLAPAKNGVFSQNSMAQIDVYRIFVKIPGKFCSKEICAIP